MEIDRDLLERLFERYLRLRYMSHKRSAESDPNYDPNADDVEWQNLHVDSSWDDAEMISNIRLVTNYDD